MKKPNLGVNFKLSLTTLLFISAVLCILGFVGVLVFLSPKIKSNYDSFEKEEESVSRLKSKSNTLDGFASKVSILEQDNAVLHNVLPNKIDIPGFMGRVSKVATDSAVLIDSFQFVSKGRTPSDKVSRAAKTASFSLSVSGSYSEIVTYVTNLENFASIVDFETFEINSVKGEGNLQPDLLEASFSLIAYYLSSDDAGPNIEGTISFDLGAASFKDAILKAKGMVYWQSEQYENPVGKSNPFLR